MHEPDLDQPAPADQRVPVVRRRSSPTVTPSLPSLPTPSRSEDAPTATAPAASLPPLAIVRRRQTSRQQQAVARPQVVARRPVLPTTVQPSLLPSAAGATASPRIGQQPSNPQTPYVLRQFVAEAHRFRAEHRIAVAEGILTVHDLVEVALEPRGKPLRRISLVDLLTERPGCGPGRARDALGRLAAALGSKAASARTTIAWLIDSRVNGTRILAWLDAVETADLLPEGFPFSDIDRRAS